MLLTTSVVSTQPLPGRPGRGMIVGLPTEIDVRNAAMVRDGLLAVLNTEPAMLVVDMTGTRFCAVAGVHALRRASRRAGRTGTEVRIAVTAPVVRRLLALTGVHHLVGVYPSVQAASAVPDPPRAFPRHYPREARDRISGR